ncbi:MAG: hypothetical protein ABEJ56_02300 [Candidatus Nanohaloarchaea archaeon]
MDELIERLEDIGFNRDVVIDHDEWLEERERMHETRLSLAGIEGKDEKTFRDDRFEVSLELKDCSHLDMEGDYIAELEKFNPEHHPVLHILTDFPVWFLKNRIFNRQPEKIDPGDEN